MTIWWTVALTFGTAALAAGLIGLAAGRLDGRILTNRRRLGALAVLGLLLVFAGSAPPTRASARAAPQPGATSPEPVPVRDLLVQWEARSSPVPDPEVLPVQQKAYEKWEGLVVSGYEKAERALDAVPQIMDALGSGALDRFTAWMHLARVKQDANQARLSVHAIRPPAMLDLAVKQRLERALDGLNESLQHRHRALAHMQHYVRTLKDEELQRAAAETELAHIALLNGVIEMTWVKARLGLLRETPAATAALPGPAGPAYTLRPEPLGASSLAVAYGVYPPASR